MKNVKSESYKTVILLTALITIAALQISAQIGTPEIQGPDKISWDSVATYTLVIKNGERITKSGLTVDWVSGMQVSLPGKSAMGQLQIVKTPIKPGDFKKTTFTLSATTTLQTPTGNKKVTVTKTITISSVEKECEEINAEIRSRLTAINKRKGEISALELDVYAIKVPKLTSPEEFKSLEYDLAKKRNELGPLLEAIEVITGERTALRTTERQMQAARHRLWQKMHPATKLGYANTRFKKSKKTKRDKIDFVRAVLGRERVRNSVSSAALENLVGVAKENVRNGLAPIVANSVFEFAKLLKLVASLGSKLGVLRNLGKIAFQQVLSSAIKSELDIDSVIKKSGYSKNQQADMERLAQVLPAQLNDLSKSIQKELKTLEENENNRQAERASSSLNIKIALAHDKIIDAINSLPPESIYQKAIANANRPASKLRREIAILEAKISNLKRANDRIKGRNQEAFSKRNFIQVGKINPAVRELNRLEKELADTKKRQKDHCYEDEENPKKPNTVDQSKKSPNKYDAFFLGEWVLAKFNHWGYHNGMRIKFVREKNGFISGYIVKASSAAKKLRRYRDGQLFLRNGISHKDGSLVAIRGEYLVLYLDPNRPSEWKQSGLAVNYRFNSKVITANILSYTFKRVD